MSVRSLLDIPQAESAPMTNEQSQLMMMLLMDKDGKMGDLHNKVIAESPMHKVLYDRLRWIGIEDLIDIHVLVFVGALCKGFGHSTLWAYTLLRLTQKYKNTYTLDDFCEDFPFGLPTEAQYKEYWRMQKVKANSELPSVHGNLLDHLENYFEPAKA